MPLDCFDSIINPDAPFQEGNAQSSRITARLQHTLYLVAIKRCAVDRFEIKKSQEKKNQNPQKDSLIL